MGFSDVFRAKYLPLLMSQVALIILYGVFVRYETVGVESGKQVNSTTYAMFQDVHVMIFIGFGFLMTFLKRYGYSALGFNLLLAAVLIQWAVICTSFFKTQNGYIRINILSLFNADVATATSLISMGALLGRTTCTQLIFMGIIETMFFGLNAYFVVDYMKAADCGGSIAVHTFGAYFGLAVSFAMRSKNSTKVGDVNKKHEGSYLEGASYNSDITAMIGTIFLWIFWPSFNAGLLASDAEQYRAIIITYLSLASATVTAFGVSSWVCEGKFDMVHVQNSTLAGGVAVGALCNMMVEPYAALIIGAGAGTLSVLGYHYLTPKLDSALGLKDTCGVHNLHGMPGVYSGFISAIVAATASIDVYGSDLYGVFPAMAKRNPMTEEMEEIVPLGGYGRSTQKQAGYQALAVVATVIIAVITGYITGTIMKTPIFEQLALEDRHDDAKHWELPEKTIPAVLEETITSVSVIQERDNINGSNAGHI